MKHGSAIVCHGVTQKEACLIGRIAIPVDILFQNIAVGSGHNRILPFRGLEVGYKMEIVTQLFDQIGLAQAGTGSLKTDDLDTVIRGRAIASLMDNPDTRAVCV